MEQDSNYITIEAGLKISMKDYRIVLGLKKTWILAAIIGGIQLLAWLIRNHHL